MEMAESGRLYLLRDEITATMDEKSQSLDTSVSKSLVTSFWLWSLKTFKQAP